MGQTFDAKPRPTSQGLGNHRDEHSQTRHLYPDRLLLQQCQTLRDLRPFPRLESVGRVSCAALGLGAGSDTVRPGLYEFTGRDGLRVPSSIARILARLCRAASSSSSSSALLPSSSKFRDRDRGVRVRPDTDGRGVRSELGVPDVVEKGLTVSSDPVR